MSWIDEKAHAELARVREAKEKQVYPYFRKFEKGGLHTSDRRQADHQLQLERLPRAHQPPEGEGGGEEGDRQVRVGLSSSRRAGDHRGARRARAAPREVVRLRQSASRSRPATRPCSGRSRRSPTRTRRSSSTATATPASWTGPSSPPACRAARRRSGSSTTTRQEPRAHPEVARAQERARPGRGRLLARRRQGEPRRSSWRSAIALRCRSRRRRRARHGDARHARHVASSRSTGLEGSRSRSSCPPSRRRSAASAASLLGKTEVIDLIKHNARSFLFSATLPGPGRRCGIDHPRHARGRGPGARGGASPEAPTTSAAS